jgi:glycosyltransferase involved in cell wall biosynthesis
MILKNEERNLPACLASGAGLAEDLVIVDTGSNDRTVEIAHQHGATIVHFPWVDSFAAARNESLRHARGEWVFWLDADDRLDTGNQERMRRLIQALPDANVAFVRASVTVYISNGQPCSCIKIAPTMVHRAGSFGDATAPI